MDGSLDQMMESVRQESEARAQALARLLATADSAKVFGQPVSAGGYTVIPAAEVASGGGFGSGMGFGMPQKRSKNGAASSLSAGQAAVQNEEARDVAGAADRAVPGAGGGGGGGGGAMARPVAAIVVGPDGVEVHPVLDFTKLAITALGAFGAAAALTVRLWAKRR